MAARFRKSPARDKPAPYTDLGPAIGCGALNPALRIANRLRHLTRGTHVLTRLAKTYAAAQDFVESACPRLCLLPETVGE